MVGAGERQVVVLVADLSGYTALTEAHGPREAAGVIARYLALARTALRPEARLVERVGDELLVLAPTSDVALASALALRQAVEGETSFPDVRMGAHAGGVLELDGAVYGSAVNYAARVAGQAAAGQILCTSAVASATTLPDVRFRALGEARLRNIVAPVALFEVVAGRPGDPVAIDPVCRMRVDPATAAARLVLGGRTYHFCSAECARRFAARPADYGA